MTEQKRKINRGYVLFGILLLATIFLFKPKAVNENSLLEQKITLRYDVKSIGGGRYHDDRYYRIISEEFSAPFIIEDIGEVSQYTSLGKLIKKGNTLLVKISASTVNNENNEMAKIPIYYLKKGNQVLFNTADYNAALAAYNRRWNYILLIGAVLSILRGLAVINSKATFIIGGMALIVIIVLRFSNLW